MSDLTETYKKAAEAIKSAHFLFVGAGAGMSADGGLPIYSTLNEDKVFQQLGLTYDQVASPTMLVKNPDLFYGVELSTLEKFRNATPHEGYTILNKWRTEIISRLETEQSAHRQFVSTQKQKLKDELITAEYEKDIPSSCFVVTSNIDGHFARSGFDSSLRSEEEKAQIFGLGNSNEVHNVHGIVYRWQCAGVPSNDFTLWKRGPCCQKVWEAPTDYVIDHQVMHATFVTPPKCQYCNDGVTKPNTYLFGDGRGFVENENVHKKRQYDAWTSSVAEALKSNPKLKLVILEVGCGLRIPSIRKRCEEMYQKCGTRQCEFIRINPEYPDNKLIISPSISIKGAGLSSLQEIEKYIL